MLRAHEACRHPGVFYCLSFLYCFLCEWVKDRQKLNGDSFNVNGLIFCLVALPSHVFVNRRQDNKIAAGGADLNKNIGVSRIEWLKIIDGSDSSPDGVFFNDSIFDHPVDNFECFFHTELVNTLTHSLTPRLTTDPTRRLNSMAFL